MSENNTDKDAPNVVVHPPIALALAVAAALVLSWLLPLPFIPDFVPRLALGLLLFILALVTVMWSGRTFRKANTQILTSQPASKIVDHGPYRYSRNPIYVASLLGLIGLAVFFDSLWFIVALVVMYAVIRFGVIAQEEIYLESKFGALYLDYKKRVRRWL